MSLCLEDALKQWDSASARFKVGYADGWLDSLANWFSDTAWRSEDAEYQHGYRQGYMRLLPPE